MTHHKEIHGGGALGANLMIITDSPSNDDLNSGKLLSGSTGRMLDSLLKESGINRDSCWTTSLSKKYITPNIGKKKIPFKIRAETSGVDLESQITNLREEIRAVGPNCILTLGGTSLAYISGKTKIQNFRGSILPAYSTKVVGTYHPRDLTGSNESSEIKGYWNKYIIIADMKRALKQSTFKEYNPPYRTLEVCKNSEQLRQFIDRYADKKITSADIEAHGQCIPFCIGFAFNRHHGLSIPFWNNDGSLINTPDSDMVNIWILIQYILDNFGIIGQNFNYDRDKLKRLGFSVRNHYDDLMMKAFCINPEFPKGLAFNTSIYTEEPFYKDEGMYEGEPKDLLLGCARDSCVQFEVNEEMDKDLIELNLQKFYRNFLMTLPEIYAEIESTGFVIDYENRDLLLKKYVSWRERINYELYRLAEVPINIRSPKQVSVLLFNVWKLPARNGTGEEELTSLLNLKSFTNTEYRKGVELILEGRRVNKTIDTYLYALPDYDGRMKTTCFPCLETGRTSNGQQDPPIRPTIEMRNAQGKKVKKSMGIAYQTITKHGDIGQDVRGCYRPDKGYVLVNIDSSQAEARVTSRFSNDDRMLALYDTNDIHALTASWFLGGTEEQYSKKLLGYECSERFLGKTLRHAGERGARGKRAMNEVNTSARKYKIDIRIDEQMADAALKTFHKMCPNIQNVYFKEVTEIINRSRTLTAPLPYGVDAESGGKRSFFERHGDELIRQALSYLPQRAVSDNTKNAAVRIKKLDTGARLVMESHDALLYMVRESEVDEFVPVAKIEMERPIDFSNCSLPRPSLSIPSDVEIGDNFMSLNKYRKVG